MLDTHESICQLSPLGLGTAPSSILCRGLETLQTPGQTVRQRQVAGPPDSRVVTVLLPLRRLGGPTRRGATGPAGQLPGCHLDHSTACPWLTSATGAGHPSSAASTAPPPADFRCEDTLVLVARKVWTPLFGSPMTSNPVTQLQPSHPACMAAAEMGS